MRVHKLGSPFQTLTPKHLYHLVPKQISAHSRTAEALNVRERQKYTEKRTKCPDVKGLMLLKLSASRTHGLLRWIITQLRNQFGVYFKFPTQFSHKYLKTLQLPVNKKAGQMNNSTTLIQVPLLRTLNIVVLLRSVYLGVLALQSHKTKKVFKTQLWKTCNQIMQKPKA